MHALLTNGLDEHQISRFEIERHESVHFGGNQCLGDLRNHFYGQASDSGPLRCRCASTEQHILDCYHIARRFEAIVKGLVPSSYRGFGTPAVESLTSLDSREGERISTMRTNPSPV
jgi:hypothetical protein